MFSLKEIDRLTEKKTNNKTSQSSFFGRSWQNQDSANDFSFFRRAVQIHCTLRQAGFDSVPHVV